MVKLEIIGIGVCLWITFAHLGFFGCAVARYRGANREFDAALASGDLEAAGRALQAMKKANDDQFLAMLIGLNPIAWCKFIFCGYPRHPGE